MARRITSWTPRAYEQLHIDGEVLGDSVNYLIAEMMIKVEFYGSEPVGIELPQTVDLRGSTTAPGIKGATASNQVKPARLETGLVVKVPPFVNNGDRKSGVNTETGDISQADLQGHSEPPTTQFFFL